MTIYNWRGLPRTCETCPAVFITRTGRWCEECRKTQYAESQKAGEKRIRKAKRADERIAELIARRAS